MLLSVTMVWCMVAGSVDAADETAKNDVIEETVFFAEGERNEVLSGECGENVRFVLTDDGTITFSGTGEMDFIALYYNDKIVNSITCVVVEDGVENVSSSAFLGCSNLKEVILANSVKTIASGAFASCTNLTKINIPESISRVERDAFSGTPWAEETAAANNGYLVINGILVDYVGTDTDLQIPTNVTSINESVFCGNNNIITVYIPENVTRIGACAFSYCTNLKEVNIPNGVTQIEFSTFQGCNDLVKIEIPDSVTEIESDAFFGCSSLTEIIIPDSVTEIGQSAFGSCIGLKEMKIPDSVVSVGEYAFGMCKNLTDVIVSNSVTAIEYGTFYGCTSLSEVEIPKNITALRGKAFFNTAMTDLTIPDSVTIIEKYAVGYVDVKNELGEYEAVDGFKIYGYKGTEAEKYANNVEAFEFIALDEPNTPGETGLEIVADKTDEVYVNGSEKGAVIYCTGELSEFVSVEMDGVLVAPENYTLEEGSTILTFTAAYMDTLSVGAHKVKLNYIDDSITTTLTIAEKESNAPSDDSNTNEQPAAGNNPSADKGSETTGSGTVQTGDTSDMMLWMSAAVFAMVAVSVVIFRRKKAL